jgi:FMN hydrolase / 5-amino-6-(5-phospho-D-ribitylamino)uracil phosphatase
MTCGILAYLLLFYFMLDLNSIKAISLDLDDTLWPVWPAIEKAEKALDAWLCEHAPMTAALFANPLARLEIREHVVRSRPELKHNLSAVRREAIRVALYRSGENPLLAEEAFSVFFAQRNRVTLFEDALPALEMLSARFPIVALSNGNADIELIGIKRYFHASISAHEFGVGKPDPRIFHAAAGAMDTVPENVLHIGDDVQLDVLGALNAGMQTGWLNRAANPWEHPETPHITVSSLAELCAVIAA